MRDKLGQLSSRAYRAFPCFVWRLPRDHLCFLLWPGASQALARRTLSVVISQLRHMLPSPDLLVAAADGVGMRPDAGVTDRAAFAALAVDPLATICVRLDGLPLALGLAVARLRLMPAQAPLRRLDRRLALLTHGPQDLPERQRALRGVITWSEGLLDSAAHALFAATAVCAGSGRPHRRPA